MKSDTSLETYLDGKLRDGAALFRNFASLAQACGDDVTTSVSRTGVDFKRTRTFARGFVQRRQLGIEIDLLRQVEHPCLKESVLTADNVYCHKLQVSSTGELYTIVDLLHEAYETVGSRAS